MTTCPFCNQEIENDSFFCDQCGKELMICPNGHGIKKGKFCTQCTTQTALVPAKDFTENVATPAPLQSATIIPSPKNDAPQPEKTIRPAAPTQSPKFLVNAALNARLELKNGAIIGRRTGDYVNVFATQGYVSGTHARLEQNGNDWQIVDLDSSNGTFLNGVKLNPNQPYVFKIGDTIAFYDVKFEVNC
ncbi:MAG: FHA domain-containing protein [Lentimicrobiaceae bacterium]|nr:FHA domain-containing protein [Lentimicrobiaceae bacterium]